MSNNAPLRWGPLMITIWHMKGEQPWDIDMYILQLIKPDCPSLTHTHINSTFFPTLRNGLSFVIILHFCDYLRSIPVQVRRYQPEIALRATSGRDIRRGTYRGKYQAHQTMKLESMAESVTRSNCTIYHDPAGTPCTTRTWYTAQYDWNNSTKLTQVFSYISYILERKKCTQRVFTGLFF